KRMTLHQYLTGYGTVEPMPASQAGPPASASLAPAVAGVVARVNVVEGQHVDKGDLLVELNSGTVTLDYARQEVERQKKLYAEHNTSERNLQNAEAQLAVLQMTSPLSGTAVHVNAKPGAAVDLTTVAVEVFDLNRLALRANLPAADAAELKSGQEVQVQTEPPVTATLSFISPAIDASNGTVMARASLPQNSALHPGQFVGLRVVIGIHTNCLAAPAESVVTDLNGTNVIALVNGTEATQTPVQVGYRENGWVEVSGSDLHEGQTVVTVGAYGLPQKTKIEMAHSSDQAATPTNSAPAK
ncbi:MAG TPA: efflux RND transporter periplasmic adaptor subunit, partial [Verrucomicrobiae bacterium]|nr:efflux RND transporter periplasmic adaptor subunit [Verrucomicrobiae bacterium]